MKIEAMEREKTEISGVNPHKIASKSECQRACPGSTPITKPNFAST